MNVKGPAFLPALFSYEMQCMYLYIILKNVLQSSETVAACGQIS